MAEQAPVGVIGVGWVGLVTAVCFAELGHEVTAVDIAEEKVAALREGRAPIHEPGIDELLERNAERLRFTTQMPEVLDRARLLFCCVDTPPTYSGDADLTSVRAVVGELTGDGEHALVMKSTVPAGTGAAIRRDVPNLAYVSCPEFLKEGTAVEDFLHPDRVVIGADAGSEWAVDAVEELYRPLGGDLVRTDVASAEMIKLASNAFLATKISFINEIANVSEEVGADVSEVARGMGLDQRIGPSFLRAGIGYGGSCLAGDETVLVRWEGVVCLRPLATLFEAFDVDSGTERRHGLEVVEADGLEVLSWAPGDDAPEFRPVEALTRRPFTGEVLTIRTKMGRRVRCTPDHPFVVADADGSAVQAKLAEELSTQDWLPVAQGLAPGLDSSEVAQVAAARVDAGIAKGEVIVRPSSQALDDIVRTGALRLDEAERLAAPLDDARLGTARKGTYVPSEIEMNEQFWRVVGFYIAEGHCAADGRRRRLQWSFHPTSEMPFVAEVDSYWRSLGVKTYVRRGPTSTSVSISSRLLAAWWCDVLGLGRNCYEQRIPDVLWTETEPHRRALLAGMWLGDGSWSYVNRGPSVILEYGTASRELADGLLRLLGDFGVMASLRVARTAKSTCDNFWITVSGADQIEKLLDLVEPVDRTAIEHSLARQAKRIAPTGYRRRGTGAAWVRVTGVHREKFDGAVYSLEVPATHTFVTSGGVVTHNCFPKDVTALKMLAGNSGYHFQLLNAVIEVNELQKRRVISKLTKHLGSLVGKRVALLGLAFKPHTDDMREASSLVLAARLQGEGATVTAYDPVAEEAARGLLPNVEFADSPEAVIDGADAVVLVTEWPEFAELEWASLSPKMRKALVVDGRNFLDPEALRAAGFIYEGIGRSGGGPVREEAPVEGAQT